MALLVTEQRHIGQNQRFVLLQRVCGQFFLMHEIEEEATLKQRRVKSIHVVRDIYARRCFVEQVCTLSHHNANVGDAVLVPEMRIVPRCPLEELARRLEHPAILTQAFLGAMT